jgi:FMN phosphatase YigB (HAD superfamily)
MKTYGIAPQNTVFIDDKQNNVEAAQTFGIQSIHFQNAAQLRKDLQKLKLL